MKLGINLHLSYFLKLLKFRWNTRNLKNSKIFLSFKLAALKVFSQQKYTLILIHFSIAEKDNVQLFLDFSNIY